MCRAQGPRWACLTFLTCQLSHRDTQVWGSSCWPYTWLWPLGLHPTPSSLCLPRQAVPDIVVSALLLSLGASIKQALGQPCYVHVPVRDFPSASCTDLRRLFWEGGFRCLPRVEGSQGGAEEVLSCSRAHSRSVTLWCHSPVGLCASGQGTVMEARFVILQDSPW